MLEVEGLHTFYGDSHIVQGVDLHIGGGECVAILGRNGAGKTTTLRSIVGLTRPRRGRIVFNGIDISTVPTRRVIMAGIAYVPEDRGIFGSVTVHEHLRLAFAVARRKATFRSPADIYAVFPRLAERRHSLGGSLSGGEQQMLAIGRALALNPKLLILDEPSEGLAPVIVEQLGAVLQAVRQRGTPILLVEQNYALALSLADRAYVLGQGRVQFQGTKRELQASEGTLRSLLSL